MMDRISEIIITKTIVLIKQSNLKTLDFTLALERKKGVAYNFFTEIFANTEEINFSYISCGLSDKSHAKLREDDQKEILLAYAEHLEQDFGQGLPNKLKKRELCVDGSYGEEWLPVDGDDIIFKKKIEECCKKGKKTEKRTCFPPKNGGVDCDPSVLHLRCKGFLSVGYCPAFIRSKKGKICKGDNRVLKEFSDNDAIKSRDRCEEDCSKKDCWGCSVQNIDGMNYKWNALTQCKSIAVWDGKIEGDITRKPGNDIMIPGTVLLEGEFITSPNGENQLWMQNDGNLVLYRRKSWIWATHTEQKCSGCTFHFQIDDVDDGISYNLLLKDNKNKIWWKYPELGKLDVGSDALELKDDGTLVLTIKLQYIDHINKVFIETKTANITFALSPHTNSGSDWGEAERCPFPYFSNKMELRIIEICKRKNSRGSCLEWHSSFKAIRLTCSDGITTTSSSEQLPSWDSLKECTEGSFIKKMRQKSTEFECTDGSQHRHVNYQGKYIKGAGTWSGWSSCEDGSAVYGIQTRVEADDSDTIKDVIFLCGELPVDKYHIETPRITFPDDRYGYWGDWGAVERCPFPHFANKMELKIEEQQRWDDTALNGIRLTCTDGATIITSSVGQWGSWGEVKECTEGTIKRTKLRREIPGGDDTSANGIRFECTDGTSHKPGDGYWGSWSEWRSCGDGSAVYGIQTRVEDSAHDDTALNDVRFFCAKIIIPTG